LKKLSICSNNTLLLIVAKKPKRPVFTPIIGILESLTIVVADKIVPSPPKLNKNLTDLSKSS